MRRKHEIVGSSPTALTPTVGMWLNGERAPDERETLVRLHPSPFMAADDQWPISGL